MSHCLITPTARRSLSDIWLYIAKDNVSHADRTVDRLLTSAHLIADNPEIGVARPDLAPGVRGFSLDRRYIILYRAIEAGIEVLYFVHGARNLRRLKF